MKENLLSVGRDVAEKNPRKSIKRSEALATYEGGVTYLREETKKGTQKEHGSQGALGKQKGPKGWKNAHWRP